MPKAAECPNCGSPLSETSVLALAPVCERCGTVVMETGGTLGATSAYGVNDPTITRARIEADLAVFTQYLSNYFGMREACKEQLIWGVERYAKLPQKPELLQFEPIPPLAQCVMKGLGRAALWDLYCCLLPWFFTLVAVVAIVLFPFVIASLLYPGLSPPIKNFWFELFFYGSGTVVWWGAFVLYAAQPHYKAKRAAGERPKENARRQRAYEAAYAAAFKAA